MNQLRLLEIKTVLSGSPDLDREISVAAPTSPVLFFSIILISEFTFQ